MIGNVTTVARMQRYSNYGIASRLSGCPLWVSAPRYALRQFTRRITCRIWSGVRARLRRLIGGITRRIVQRFGRWIMQGVPSGRRRIWVLVHKNILLASVTKNNAPLTGSFPSGRRYKGSNGKDQVTNCVAPANKQKR